MSLDAARPPEQPLSGVADLVQVLRSAEKRPDSLQVGLEHEKLLFLGGASPPTPVPYEGPRGVRALLEAMGASYEPYRDRPDGPPIALIRGAAQVSLEPGGQVELSGTPVVSVRELHRENLRHLAELSAAAAPLGVHVTALGYRPVGTAAQMPWVPKARYEVMRRTLGSRGPRAIEMMTMTATAQVSLDWTDEADCARKVGAVARLAPLMVALYANSPLVQGAPAGVLSHRSRVWTETDPARCGYLPSMIDGTFSYGSYVEWALDVPLLFLRREGTYRDVMLTFRQLLAQGFEGRPATMGDWVDHLSTLFPEVRLKRVIEIRGADSVGAAQTAALAALWRGVLYDSQALAEAEQLLPALSFAEHLELHRDAAVRGLKASLRGAALKALAADLVRIARGGLKRLDAEDAPLLDPLAEIAESGVTPAERVLEAWNQDRDPLALVKRFAP